MANAHKVVGWVVMEPLRMLKANGTMNPSFNTSYNKELTKEYAIGESFEVPFPFDFAIRDGEEMDTQDVTRKTTTIRMASPYGVDFNYSGFEQALQMGRGENMLKEDFIDPAANKLMGERDMRLARQAYQRVPKIVGALGTDPSTIDTYHTANQRLEELGCPPGERRLYMTPAMSTRLLSASSSLYLPNDDFKDMWREGKLGMLSMAKAFRSTSLWQHTTGIVTSAAALTVNAAVANGATTVTINCTTGDTFKAYDRVCFAASFEVHPQKKKRFGTALGNQATYIVQNDVTATGATCVLTLDRPIYGPGDLSQNVDALPASNALVTRWPGTNIPDADSVTGSVGVILHKDALALVSAKLKMPKQAEIALQRRDPETGTTLSIAQQWEIRKWKYPTRMDLWEGYGGLYPANAGICVLGV